MATEKIEMTEEMISNRVKKLQKEIGSLGRWAVVTWWDGDLAVALEDHGYDPTEKNIQRLKQRVDGGEGMADALTIWGYELIYDAIDEEFEPDEESEGGN